MEGRAKIKHTAQSHRILRLEISDKIALISMDNPPVNALKIALLNKLDKTIGALNKNPGVKVIIITGKNRIFSSGADIKEMSTRKSGKHARAMSSLGQQVLRNIENCPKPVIAAINGFCLGGGLELALSCHIRIASDHSILGMPEISLGMIPAFGGSYRLPRIVGKSRAIELVLSGRKIRSEEALDMGLVDLIVPGNNLVQEARKCAGKWTGKSSASMKQVLYSITQGYYSDFSSAMDTESACVEELYNSHDLKEGIFAYLEKRKPEFRDC